MPDIEVMHDDVKITYSEQENQWEFVLRGRSRKAVSLSAAREAINKPAPKEKTFTQMEAIMLVNQYDREAAQGYKKVRVTSIAENTWRDAEVWVIDLNGNRSKESATRVFEITPENLNLIEQRKNLRNEIQQLEKRHELLKLTPIKLPVEIDG